jgi:Domain of unknown function (DUF4159)
MRHAASIAIVVVLVAVAVAAQQEFFRGYGRGYNRVPPRLPKPEMYDGAFSFCRGLYTSGFREPSGSGWNTDYPDADVNFSIRVSELTRVRVGKQPTGDPNHVVVPLTDDWLFMCPQLHLEDVGTAQFTDEEVMQLRRYLLKGGFVWADDSWGSFALANWEEQIARVLPSGEYPIRDITPDHPVFTTMFQIAEMPQIPSISHWRRSGGGTSERGTDSDQVVVRGISDREGRLMVLMTHNTDISDAWEREGEDPRYFYNFSPNGYAVGINILMYSMTH